MLFRRVLPVLCGALMMLPVVAQEAATLSLTPVGTFSHAGFDEGGSEINAYHPASKTLFVVNAGANALDLLDLTDVGAPSLNITLKTQIVLDEYGDGINSVAIYGDIVAAAIANDQDNGVVAFFTPDGTFVSQVTVGALPDMVIFTPDGTKVLTANEGEPSDDYATDPEGSVSIIDISGGIEGLTDAKVTTVSLETANDNDSLIIYGPNATVAQDVEPEYIAISEDSTTAYVVAQENNGILAIDIASAALTSTFSLGTKDLSVEGNGIDGGKDDGVINIANYPIQALYRPDAIVIVGEYLITANEGDTRDYDGYSEEGELGETPLDETVYPNADELATEDAIGGLEILTSVGDTDGDGDIEQMTISGARSISTRTLTGELAWDSGDQMERTIAEVNPENFNATHDENGSFDDRSDNAGPEPEGLAVGMVGDKNYLFVGFERIGGVMVYDLSTLPEPTFVTYVNNRDFEGDAEAGTAGDLGPEGLTFVAAADSPNGVALLIVSNEISSTTTIYEVK